MQKLSYLSSHSQIIPSKKVEREIRAKNTKDFESQLKKVKVGNLVGLRVAPVAYLVPIHLC